MLFIFDWDGTLCDSTGKIASCMQQAAHHLGLPVPEESAVFNIIGLGLPEAVARLYPEMPDTTTNALREAYSRFFLADTRPCVLFDGVEEALHKLRDNGYSLTVATGKSRRGLDRVLTEVGLSAFFHGSRCADETRSKPHPLMLQELLSEFTRSAEESVMVGDTEYDMAMAMAIGMPRVAVSYGAHHATRLHSYEPVLCMDHFSEIMGLVRDATLVSELKT